MQLHIVNGGSVLITMKQSLQDSWKSVVQVSVSPDSVCVVVAICWGGAAPECVLGQAV